MIARKTRKRSHLRDIRDRNRMLVIGELLKCGPVSRHDLSSRTGLTDASVSRIARELIEDGICYDGASYRAANKLGRKRVELCINPDGGFVLAICLSAFSRRLVLTDITGTRRFETEFPGNSSSTAEESVEFAGTWLEELFSNRKLRRTRLLGAGVVIAGSVEHQTGLLKNAPLLGWRDIPIRDLLMRKLRSPVVVENVADALCLAYLDQNYSTKNSHVHMILVHVAYGMGASLVIDSKIVRRRGDEGWIGQLPVHGANRSSCQALHEVASGSAILRLLEKENSLSGRNISSGKVAKALHLAVEASNGPSPAVKKTFQSAGAALGNALLPITAAFQPDVIALAGPIVASAVYRQAVIDAYSGMTNCLGITAARLAVNQTSYIDAAENLALRSHFLSVSPG